MISGAGKLAASISSHGWAGSGHSFTWLFFVMASQSSTNTTFRTSGTLSFISGFLLASSYVHEHGVCEQEKQNALHLGFSSDLSHHAHRPSWHLLSRQPRFSARLICLRRALGQHCCQSRVLCQIHSARVGRRWLEAFFVLQYSARCT